MKLNQRKDPSHSPRKPLLRLNSLDKQGTAFILTLALGIVGITAAWGTDRAREKTALELESEYQTMPEIRVAEAAEPVPSEEPEVIETVAQEEPALAAWQLPAEGNILIPFANDELLYNDTLNEWRTHTGIDLQADAGAPVFTPAAGTVEEITDDRLMGITITMRHEDGNISRCAGLASLSEGVERGVHLNMGDPLGTVGTPAFEEWIGPHVHFEVRSDAGFIDPASLI